jgi:hypothetical protein
MKQMLFPVLALAVALLASACAPMIENGRDHRHDPQFEKARPEKH